MPVHWYYNREALDADYPDLSTCQAPLSHHPNSILWRSEFTPVSEKADILHEQVAGAGEYDPTLWAEHYIGLMLTPDWHRATYLEEYHRAFFNRYASGKKLLKCGISDEHIGGLVTAPALIAALLSSDHRQTVKEHVTLTHRHSNVLRAADCLTRLIQAISEGTLLREALMKAAGDWSTTCKAETESRQPDRTVIGQRLSPACYVDQAFPASLYLAWKYHDDFPSAALANAKAGGDNCQRGAVVGALVAAEVMRTNSQFNINPFPLD